jgi:syntaxin 1B/2/3
MAAYGQSGQGPSQSSGRNPNSVLSQTQDIDRGIDAIYDNLRTLQNLQQRSLADTDESPNTATNRELNNLSASTMNMYRDYVRRLKSIQALPESTTPMNAQQVKKVDERLKTAISKYQSVEADFQKKLQAHMARRYRIVRPDASEDEVREAVESGSGPVFSQALMQSDRRGQAQSALRAVQDRHRAIQEIERQMEELANLFEEVNALVEQQAPMVEQSQAKGEETVQHLEQGTEQLKHAIVSRRAANKKKWICLGIVSKL